MLDCPEISVLEHDTTSIVREHVAQCSSCRIVVELLEERRHGVDARNRRDECTRFEMLLAARDEGTIGGSAGAMLDAHLRECFECQAVAATMPPASERREHTALPNVSTASYALGREVARGGMGRIFEALDVRIGRPVAVKELLGKAPALAARFEREARVTARLQHPGIVPIYEIGKWPDGTPFYAMRMVEGRTLREAIRERPLLDERLALLPEVIAAVDAVAFAHGKRIIHRDLTPNNILVGEYGDTVVIDWGLAKDLTAEAASDEDLVVGPYRDESSPNADLTTLGAVIGTAAYMPPEQANGAVVDERADVYALGAILYHVLAGAAPFRSSKSDEVLRQVQSGPPVGIAKVALGAPRDLVSIVGKAMARSPSDRYATAAELAAELRRFQTGRLVEAHHYTPGERARRWLRDYRVPVFASAAALIAIAIAGSIGLVGIVRERDHAEREKSTAVEQRSAADTAKANAERMNTSLMAEQGRQELLAGNTTRALAWLNEAYKAGDTSTELRLMLGTALRRVESIAHTYDCSVQSIEFSPDGEHAIAACDGAISLVRISDWTDVARIQTKLDGATFSHDGRLIASWRYTALSVWDAATGAQRFTGREHTASIRNVMFTPDARLLVTTGDDALVKIWEVATGKVIRTIDGRSGKMNVVRGVLLPDGKTLLTVTSDGVVNEWNIETGARRLTFKLPGQPIAEGSVTPDGRRYATCHTDGSVRISDLESGRILTTFAAHAYASFDCVFSKDGRLLLTTGVDGLAKAWNATTGQLISTMAYGGMFAHSTLSPDGERAATLGSDGVLRLWHVGTGSLLSSLDDPSGFSEPLAFSNDGHQLASVRGRTTIVVAKDLDGGFRSPSLPSGAEAIAISPTAQALAIKSASGAVTIVDGTTLLPVSDLSLHAPLAWSSDGTRVAGTVEDGVVVIDLHGGRTLAHLRSGKPETLALDEHGHRLLVGSSDSQVWDVDRERIEVALAEQSDADSLSRDGKLVLGWKEHHVHVWSVYEHRVKTTIELAGDMLGAVGYPADGRNVLVAEKDSTTPIASLPFTAKVGGYDLNTGSRSFVVPPALFAQLDSQRRHIVLSGIRRDLEVRDATDGKLTSRITPGPGFVEFGQLVLDGTAIAVANGATASIRSLNDGRELARAQLHLQLHFSQDTFNAGGDLDFVEDGRVLAILGPDPLIWKLPLEQRSSAEVDRIVRTHVHWRVAGGRLVPIEATLRGRITRHGHPVEGAEVSIDRMGIVDGPHTRTDLDGRFEFSALPLGRIEVTSTDPDHTARSTKGVTLDADDVVADLELDREASISGQIVDEHDQPAVGVVVRAGLDNDDKTRWTSDAKGRFTIRALGAGTFDLAVLKRIDAKSTGWEQVGPTKVTVKSPTDSITGVRIVVRRVAP